MTDGVVHGRDETFRQRHERLPRMRVAYLRFRVGELLKFRQGRDGLPPVEPCSKYDVCPTRIQAHRLAGRRIAV